MLIVFQRFCGTLFKTLWDLVYSFLLLHQNHKADTKLAPLTLGSQSERFKYL